MAINRESKELTDDELIAGMIESQISDAESEIAEYRHRIEGLQDTIKQHESELAFEQQKIRVLESLKSAHKQINR